MDLVVFTEENLSYVFDLVEACRGISQREDKHPEGDVYIHLLQTFRRAYRESHDIDLLLAALLHDVGKVVESHGHEDHSIDMLKDYSSVKTLWLIKNHMRIGAYINGEMKKLSKCVELSEHPFFPDLVCLFRFDTMGRGKSNSVEMWREKIVELLNKAVDRRWVAWHKKGGQSGLEISSGEVGSKA